MPKRIPRYALRAWRAFLLITDRVFNTPSGRLGAYVLIVGIGVAGFTSYAGVLDRLEREQYESCQAGSRFRSEELPAAFAQHDRDLGATLLGYERFEELSPADRATIDAFIDRAIPNLREALPTREC